MSELSSKFSVKTDNSVEIFYFDDLVKKNITSQQLYEWSVPIDTIEQYEYYLESNDSSWQKQPVYICTLPRFGPMCQYQLYYDLGEYGTFSKLVSYYRYDNDFISDTTCFTHLKCNRSPLPICLDWSEICDGVVNCLDGNLDEEHCWQLELNQCEQNEYQCTMGQCIPIEFVDDHLRSHDCLDGSDEAHDRFTVHNGFLSKAETYVRLDDLRCAATFLTSSCDYYRTWELIDAMFSIQDSSIPKKCWFAFRDYLESNVFGNANRYIPAITKECPDALYFPNVPVFFGHVFTAYKKNDVLNSNQFAVPYLCSNKSFHDGSLKLASDISLNNLTCFVFPRPIIDTITYLNLKGYTYLKTMTTIFDQIRNFNPIISYSSNQCHTFNLYQCTNSSKCIGFRRVGNNIRDCPYGDDENILKEENYPSFTRFIENTYDSTYMERIYPIDGYTDKKHYCSFDDDFCEVTGRGSNLTQRMISFLTLCDGFKVLYPITIDGQNHTDETECEQWECDNLYTHCDDRWNCWDGRDEMDCNRLPITLNCSSETRICVALDTLNVTCLPLNKINDGQVDCFGGTDERRICRRKNFVGWIDGFYCANSKPPICLSSINFCNDVKECPNGEDEQFCPEGQSMSVVDDTFQLNSVLHRPIVQNFFRLFVSNFPFYPTGNQYFRIPGFDRSEVRMVENTFNPSYTARTSLLDERRCHRGLDLRVWLNESLYGYTSTCLCPPGYYGNQCQYQNERISLVIQFSVSTESWQIPLTILALLIDDTNRRIIHSYEQFTYLSARDCDVKFNFHLFYSTRPKDMNRNYSIHIDIYEKNSLRYRGSFLYPLKFLFLPVHRLAFIINIPSVSDYSCSNQQCQHGKCMKYVNDEKTFCQCDEGWSGEYCHVQHNCTCSSKKSLCIGVLADNRSICVCQGNRFGPRCYLKNRVCESFPCLHNGLCIPGDDFMTTNETKYSCICEKGFSGRQCEVDSNQINIIFDNDLHISQSVFIHFITMRMPGEIINNYNPKLGKTLERSTTLQTISQATNSIRFYWSQQFHLIFIETLDKIFYLAFLQPNYIPSTKRTLQISSSHRCPSINELTNETFAQLHVLRRMKYYHVICRQHSPHLQCFHDDLNLCLCYEFNGKRLANCADFDHEMKFDCSGKSACENGGRCFQDSPTCPKQIICACHSCYFGARCQHSTSEFGLSLDAILAYHIIPDVEFIGQATVVKISFALTTLFFIFGIINGILSLMTFQSQNVREVGCGIYLFGSSVTTILTMLMFASKYFIYLSTQMSSLSNESFLKIQCHLLDFLLRICLNMDQWLNACVALERSVTVIQGAQFNRKKSKTLAKKITLLLVTFNVLTSIHDPIYRKLTEEETENNEHKRIWCVVSYSSNLQIYNRIINTFHFFIPFLINFISSIILITKKSRQQSNLHENQPYSDELRKHLREHRHLLIGPIVLFLLALPRLILSYVSQCMNSARDSSIFLGGYFISFIPPMITFIIFVIPSEFYRKECRNSIAQFQQRIRRII
ncbi:unnamed protein product [Adineta ricciae]|uniref:Uncharacterized protein n=1 Tax=Adineta ricciae TaxID=249248 RepID=A0A815V674_ADIRI|nr:unnamed protein product [Adineta ricciae]CAF1530504.1 unnamed protein product [Adineta ricciae]